MCEKKFDSWKAFYAHTVYGDGLISRYAWSRKWEDKYRFIVTIDGQEHIVQRCEILSFELGKSVNEICDSIIEDSRVRIVTNDDLIMSCLS